MTNKYRKKLIEIAKKYGIDQIYVFGSRAKEIALFLIGEGVIDLYSKSDVDMGVCMKRDLKLSSSERVHIVLELEDLLDVSRVDLMFLEEADPFLALEIIRGELLYAEDFERQSQYELYLLRRAGDLVTFKKERIRMILEEGAR